MITIELTKAELQDLVNIMDQGVKVIGLQCVVAAATLVNKLNEAAKELPEVKAANKTVNEIKEDTRNG